MTKHKLKLAEIKASPVHGKGLFAVCHISQGSIIGKLAGKVVNTDGAHVLWMNDGKDKFKVENDLKYINHHKNPNVAYYDDFTVVALCDINCGSELLHDYGDDWD